MSQLEKKKCFIALGRFLSQFSLDKNTKNETVLHNDLFFDDFISLIELSQSHNGWFTQEQVYFSIQSWAKALTEENVTKWLSDYNIEKVQSKTVGLIMAGNIPLVGFHDFLSVLIVGHKALVKTSSNDQHLIKFLANYLIAVDATMADYIEFTDG
ncbi:MAG: acyl-CoA reductase, partial [Bacteroidota bacterium]